MRTSRCSTWFRKGKETREQIANIHWNIDKAREFQENICFCIIYHLKAFDSVDHNKLWKILQEMGIPDHLTCPLRNLYASQEATVRMGHETTDWFKIGKRVCQDCILSLAYLTSIQSSVQFSHSVMSDSLWPHEPQHTRPPCPSPTPGVQPDPCPLSRWCHPTISTSVIPFSSCPQSFPTSGSFQMSQLFTWGGQSIGVAASTSVLPVKTGLIFFRMDWLDLLAVQGTLKSLLQHHSSKFFGAQLSS